MECKVAVHPCEVLLICPAEASHAPILNRSTAIIALIYPAPDGVLGLVGEIPGVVVARLVATIARADGLLYNFGNAARAGGASAGIFLVTDADVLLYNVGDAARAGGASAGIFLVTDADGLLYLFGEVLDDAWVLTYRHAGVTKGRTVNGDSHVAAAEASHGPCCALVAHGSSRCRIPAISSDAEEEVRVGDGHLFGKRYM